MKPHAAALRRGRFSEPGHIYLVTTVTAGLADRVGDYAHWDAVWV